MEFKKAQFLMILSLIWVPNVFAADAETWWIIKGTDLSCVPSVGASGDLSPETVIRDHPGCLIMSSGDSNPKILYLDCTRSDLQTSLMYAPSLSICKKFVKMLSKLKSQGVK